MCSYKVCIGQCAVCSVPGESVSPKCEAEIRFNGREPRVPGCPVNPGCTAGLTEHVLPNTVEPQWSHLKLHITDFAIRSGCFATRAGGGLERTFSKLSYLCEEFLENTSVCAYNIHCYTKSASYIANTAVLHLHIKKLSLVFFISAN